MEEKEKSKQDKLVEKYDKRIQDIGSTNTVNMSHVQRVTPAASMPEAMSGKGIVHLMKEEGDVDTIHFPDRDSGGTIGYGYDLKERNKESVIQDLRSVGVLQEAAEEIAQGAGLKGKAAQNFVNKKIQAFTFSKEQKRKLLDRTLPYYENIVRTHVKVPLSQQQYDALVVFVYNIGDQFYNVNDGDASFLLKYLNRKNYMRASEEFKEWKRSKGKVSQGLISRRKRTKDLFLNGEYGE